MTMLLSGIQSAFGYIGPFFILLGLLIFVHELGHFLVAKYFGVRVEVFSLGFGKKIFSYKRGDTTYCLSIIPLGGYVKMYGDDPSADIPAKEKAYSFLHKPVSQRIWIVLAGPLMNLFFAITVFAVIAGIGEDLPGPFLGDVAQTSKAYEVGFRSGDKILSVQGEQTPSWTQVKKKIEAAGGETAAVMVQREGESAPLQLQVPITIGDNENIFSSDRKVGTIAGFVQDSRSTMVGVKNPQSLAAQAGIKSLELIHSIDGNKVSYWRELEPNLKKAFASAKDEVAIQVRTLDKDDRPENLRTIQLKVPAKWQRQKSLVDFLGLESSELYIYQIKPGSPADQAGLKSQDRVTHINQEPVLSWNDVLNKVKGFDPSTEAMSFNIVRNGKEEKFTIRPEMTKLMTAKGQEEKRFTIGIVSGFFPVGPEAVFLRESNPLKMIGRGFTDTVMWTEFIVISMVRLIQGEVSAKNVGGVITIGRVASHSFAAGLSTFLKTMAIISINLFLLNLLPIPVLDGGHLVFYTIEALKGAPLSMRKMELAHQIGLMLLMFLMVFAFFNDITNLIANRW